MKNLKNQIKKLEKSKVKNLVNKRLKEFSAFKKSSNESVFAELCFCILTANSKALTAIAIQKEMGIKGFLKYPEKKVSQIIRNNNHRFHNNKAKYIVEARKHKNIKKELQKIIKKDNYEEQCDAREFIVKNIKGLGYKEASHFLRNVGYFKLSILDRHILNLMVDNKIIKEKPKSLTKQKYFEIEKKFKNIAFDLNMNESELDMYMWYMKTEKILK
jgi:N-glycosylase/DNA lyase